jgi:hypothetical protein
MTPGEDRKALMDCIAPRHTQVAALTAHPDAVAIFGETRIFPVPQNSAERETSPPPPTSPPQVADSDLDISVVFLLTYA